MEFTMRKSEYITKWKVEFNRNIFTTNLTDCKVPNRPSLEMEEHIHQDGSVTIENQHWLPLEIEFTFNKTHEDFLSQFISPRDTFGVYLFLYDHNDCLLESYVLLGAQFTDWKISQFSKKFDPLQKETIKAQISFKEARYYPELCNK